MPTVLDMFLRTDCQKAFFLTQSIGDNIIISEIDKLKKKNGQFDLKKRDEEIEKWVKELEIKNKESR